MKEKKFDHRPSAPPYYEWKFLLIELKSNQKTYCLGGRHYSQTVIKNTFEKVKPKTKNPFKKIKGTCSICGRNQSQIFTK